MVSIEAALARWLALVGPLGEREERVPAEEALGRVLASPVFAARMNPHYHGAAMDGIAVRSADTAGAGEARPVRLHEGPGFARVDTGDPLPEGFDAVVMIEEVSEPEPGVVELLAAAAPRQHVRLVGEDVVLGDLLFPRAHRVRPVDVGALIAAGALEVPVVRRPTVAILPTGDELVEPGAPLRAGAIVDSNSRMLAAIVTEAGAVPRRLPVVRDDPALLREALDAAARGQDVVCVIAGSSAGRGDHTPRAIGELGELCVHGIAAMPGKPAALGVVHGTPVIGVPGFPVSAALVADLFLRPLVARLCGEPAPVRDKVRAVVRRKIASRLGLREFVRVNVGRIGGQLVAAPLGRGAGAITTLTRAQGLVAIAENVEGLEAGAEVEVELWTPRQELEETLLCVGSHDPALDRLGDLWRARRPGARLATSNVGSIGALLALQSGESHLGGAHLLDPATGEYNLPYIDRTVPGLALAVITLAHRTQGLLVAPGNPRGVRTVADLARVTFVNRQRGSGTRILTEHLCAQAGIDPARIVGWRREELTHAAVAAAVQSGAADAGVAVLAAARALGLDFVPLGEERYDLVLPAGALADPRVAELLEVATSAPFREALARLGGYDTRENGRRVR